MKIYCDENPNDLISDIGDRQFSICDQEYADGLYNHPDHPNKIRIIDCEDGIQIDVYNEFGIEDTRKLADALLQLLNQNYKVDDDRHN